MQTTARDTLLFQLLEDVVVYQDFSMHLLFYMHFLLLLVLGTGYCIRQTFGLTCYGNSFVFMSFEIYFFNHSCCELLYEVKLLIVPRKCGICLRNEFSMERVHSESLKVYGDNKHKHKGDRIISCCVFWYHKTRRYFHNFLLIYLISDYVCSWCHKPCMLSPQKQQYRAREGCQTTGSSFNIHIIF